MSSSERSGPSTPVAEIFTLGDSRTFVAERFEIVGDLVLATGQRRQLVGPSYAASARWGPRETIYFSTSREVRRIRVLAGGSS